MKKIEGKIIKNISNTYTISANGKQYEAVARGKLKLDEIKPVVGDNVEFEQIEEKAVITKILERKNYLKRPKVSNITQIIFVVSPKMPEINLNLLDKKLALAEYLKLKAVITINKKDLNEEKAEEISKLYQKVGYKTIKINAETGEGIEELKQLLQNNISVLAGKSGVRKIHNNKPNSRNKKSTSRRNKPEKQKRQKYNHRCKLIRNRRKCILVRHTRLSSNRYI